MIKIRKVLLLICIFMALPFATSMAQVWKAEYDSVRVKFNRGEIDAATAWLEEFIPKFKDAPDRDTTAYFEMVNLLGRCYLKQGFNVNAEEMFKEEVEFFKNNPQSISKTTYTSSLIYLGYMNYNLKKFDIAEEYFTEVLNRKAEQGDLKKGQHIALLNNLATIANTSKRYTRADSLYNTMLKLKKDFYGASSVEVGKTLNTMGTLCRKMGRYSEAEPLYMQANENFKKQLGESHPKYISGLNDMANLYKVQGRYAELEGIYKRLTEIIRDTYGPKSLEYARALSHLTDLYRTLSRFKEAEPICLQVIQIIEDTIGQNNLDYTNGLIELASLYKDMSDFKQSELYFLSAISIYEVIVGEYHESYVKALVHLASLYRTVGRTHEAEPLYLKALDIYRKTSGSNTMAYADLLSDYGLYFDEMGHYEQAELHFKKSLEITENLKGNKNPNYASTLDNLANLYIHEGHLEQAEPILIESARIRKEVLGSKHPIYAASLNNAANLFLSLGRISDAKKLYEEAIRIIKEVYGTKNPYYANAIDNLADVSEKEGNLEEAEKYILESLQITKQLFGEDHVYYTTAMNNLAHIQTMLNKPGEAETLYKQNIEKMKSTLGEDHPSYATALSNLADIYEYSERYKEAEELYEKALKIKKDKLGINHREYTKSLSRLAGLYTATNDFEKADALWESALTNYLREIRIMFPSMSEKEKQDFYKKIISTEFEQFNSYALLRSVNEPKVLGNMYNNQLATKALILNASNKVRQKIMSNRDTTMIRLYKSWLQQKEILSKLYSLSREELKLQRINIDSLDEIANKLEKQLSARSALFKNSNDTLSYTWRDVQKKLKEGEAAIEIIRFLKHDFSKSGQITKDVYYAALIITNKTPDHPELVVMENGNDMEKKFLNYYKNVIKFKIEDEFSYSNYWQKINEKLTGVKKVYLSPDGVYNQLNMNTIKNMTSGKFVIDEIDIQLVSNTKDLVTQYGTRNSKKQIIFFGNPDYTSDGSASSGIQSVEGNSIYAGILTQLPGTEKEVNMISEMMKNSRWNTSVNIGVNANEKAIKSINNPKVLHIATHGFFDKDMEISQKQVGDNQEKINRNPLLRSGLMLAGASVTLYNKKNTVFQADKIETTYEDGILTAYEAMNMNLDSTDLVVLSACETGLGDVENGEGVYGLQRAFIIAGAESIIISLWKVDDATTQKLMTLFYNEWLKNIISPDKNIRAVAKRKAFHTAQEILKSEYPDPYYWGAFVMVGE